MAVITIEQVISSDDGELLMGTAAAAVRAMRDNPTAPTYLEHNDIRVRVYDGDQPETIVARWRQATDAHHSRPTVHATSVSVPVVRDGELELAEVTFRVPSTLTVHESLSKDEREWLKVAVQSRIDQLKRLVEEYRANKLYDADAFADTCQRQIDILVTGATKLAL